MNRTVLAGWLAAGTLLLAACGSDGSPPAHPDPGNARKAAASATVSSRPAAGAHNATDVDFATDMIPHHAQAVFLARLARTRATTGALRSLGRRIAAEQAPEIVQLSGWLRGWRESVPSGSYEVGLGGGVTAPGMVDDAGMTGLMDATGTGFDRRWLTMMINHHRGAVAMAETELADGRNPDARKFARAVVAMQTAEIATMQALLSSGSG